MSEPDEPRSSWQRWARSAQRSPAGTDPRDDDLDVALTWGGEERSAPEDDWNVAFEDDGDDERDAAGDDVGDFGELVPSVPLLPSIAGRVEAIWGVLRSISHRVDAVSAATDVYRAATVDRIDEFTETVLEQGRRTDQSLDEYRRTTERTIAELRRRVTEQADVASQLLGRVEEIATDVTSILEGSSAPAAAATRAELGAPGLATGGADTAGAVGAPAPVGPVGGEAIDTILGELRSGQAATDHALADLRELVEVIIDTIPGSAEGSGADLGHGIARLQATLEELAGRPVPVAQEPATFDGELVGRLAEAVVDRLDLDALAALVVEHLSASFEVVTDDAQEAALPPPGSDEPLAVDEAPGTEEPAPASRRRGSRRR